MILRMCDKESIEFAFSLVDEIEASLDNHAMASEDRMLTAVKEAYERGMRRGIEISKQEEIPF